MKKREEIIAVVKSVLDKDDLMGLLALGAPEDEYEGIAQAIVDLIMKTNNIICTSEILFNVFTEEFEEDFTKEEFDDISREINNKLMD